MEEVSGVEWGAEGEEEHEEEVGGDGEGEGEEETMRRLTTVFLGQQRVHVQLQTAASVLCPGGPQEVLCPPAAGI